MYIVDYLWSKWILKKIKDNEEAKWYLECGLLLPKHYKLLVDESTYQEVMQMQKVKEMKVDKALNKNNKI